MAAKTMADYLSSATPDNNATLRVKPSKVIVEEGHKNTVIHIGDDGSEERISLSSSSIFYCTLIWTNKGASDAGTIMDFYHDSAKGNGEAESFKWEHPTDDNYYTVRFDGKLKRHLKHAGSVFFDFPNVRLKVLGTHTVPSASPSGSPSGSPSASPSEGTPSASPSGSPSGSPSASPSEGTPSGSPSSSPGE